MASKRRDVIQARDNSDGSITYRAQIRIRGYPPITKSFAGRTDATRWIEETNPAMRAGHELLDGGRAHYLQRSARAAICAK